MRSMCVLLALTIVATGVARAQQPQSAPGGWTGNVRPQPAVPAQPPPLKGTTLETPANTTIIARPTAENRTGGQVTLSAKIIEDGADIEAGVVWRVYRDKPGSDGKPRLLSLHRDAAPQLRLEVGDYLVHVAYGRANLTRKISVAAGKVVVEKFVINAGGLKVAALLAW